VNLQEHDVVLVIGPDKHLSGIVTAWDLAAEFADLVGPFKWIGEIESRVRKCLQERLGVETISSFLGHAELAPQKGDSDRLTLGDLVRVIQNPDLWGKLRLPFDREVFYKELDEVRELRNQAHALPRPSKRRRKDAITESLPLGRKNSLALT
jgi:hypothetical protein